MKKETAEISSYRNWVEERLAQDNLDIFGVEGYGLDNGDVSILLDRRKVGDVRGWNAGRAWREYTDEVSDTLIEAKCELANLAGCDFHLALYDGENVRVYRIDGNDIEEVSDLMDYMDFGRWLFAHSSKDKVKKSFVNKSQLPAIDTKLRKLGTPWPGNLDGFWWDGGDVRALIEFQTTVEASVMNHSNNRWFSQDEGRWRALDALREGVDRPLVILTWSPNEDDDYVKLKKVGNIQYNGRGRGLNYSAERLLEADELSGMMDQLL